MSKPKLKDILLPEYRSRSFGNAAIGGGPDPRSGVPGAQTGYIKIPQPPRSREDSFPYHGGDTNKSKKRREELEDEDAIMYGDKETADKMRNMLDPHGIGTSVMAGPGTTDTPQERGRAMKQMVGGGSLTPHIFQDEEPSDKPGFIEYDEDEEDLKEISTLDMLAYTGNVGRHDPGHRGAGVHQRLTKTGGSHDSGKVHRVAGFSSSPPGKTFDVPPWLDKQRTDISDLMLSDDDEDEDKKLVKLFVREYLSNEASIIGPAYGANYGSGGGGHSKGRGGYGMNTWAVGTIINKNRNPGSQTPRFDNTDDLEFKDWYFDNDRDDEIEKREKNENNS